MRGARVKLSLDDLVRTDAATLAEGMLAAVEGDGQEETDLENACNKYHHDPSCTGANRAKQKGGKSSNGNPKGGQKKTTSRQDVDAVEHAIKTTAAHGGKMEDVAKVGKQSLTIVAGNPGTRALHYDDGHGSVHQKLKHGGPPENTTPRKAANAIVHGKRGTDEKGLHAIHKQTRAGLGKTGKKGSIKMLSAYKKK